MMHVFGCSHHTLYRSARAAFLLRVVCVVLPGSAFVRPLAALEVSTTLSDLGAHGSSRWKDMAGVSYNSSFSRDFTYGTGGTHVSLTYESVGTVFSGSLTAENLKPNFAYQIKLDGGGPETYPASNENLGLAGRWWEEEWNGSSWVNGHNLNDQPDHPDTHADDYPNTLSSNDETYVANRDLTDEYGHNLYRHTGYLLLGYFVTDANGNAANVEFTLDNSYHVLFRATSGDLGQRTRDPLRDGPVIRTVLDADTSFPTFAYKHNDGIDATIDVFGQWERLPRDSIVLPQGEYNVNFRLTEESFHDGAWTTVMATDIEFDIIPEPSALVLLVLGTATVLVRRPRVPGRLRV